MQYISFYQNYIKKEWYNHTHSHEIYRLRKESVNLDKIKKIYNKIFSLPEDSVFESSTNIYFPIHLLIGKKYLQKETNQIYIVEKVCLQFYGGWYFCLVLNYKGSHALVMSENHSCMNNSILESIKQFRQKYQQL